MNIDSETRVRDVATAIPASLRHFERWGIDYCCGGGRTLRESCTRSGASLTDVVRTLREIAEAPREESSVDWRARTPDELIDHLLATHHEFTRSELHRAIALATKVSRVHGERHPWLHEVHDRVQELRADLVPHLEKEEQVLFPWIRREAVGRRAAATDATRPSFSIALPIRCMEDEHEAVGTILARLRELTDGYTPPADACGSFRALYQSLADLEADLHVHIHLENDVLFPAALSATETLGMAD